MELHLDGWIGFIAFSVFVFLIFLIPVATIAFIISLANKRRIRHNLVNSSIINAEYEPPEGLSPAEMGYLFDSKIGNKETVATLLDLEQRNILKIEKTYSSTFNVNKISQNYSNLKSHEQFLLDSLGVLQDVTINTHVIVLGFNKQVRKSLRNQGYIPQNGSLIGYFAGKTILINVIIDAVLFIYLLVSTKDLLETILLLIVLTIFCFPALLALAMVSAYISNSISGHGGLWTKKARQLWPDIEGYREYVRMVELDNLKFESEDLKIATKNKALPYAVALGFNTNWQDRFK